MINYNAQDWYWRSSKLGLFSSLRRSYVHDDDPEYLAWLSIHGAPNPWPLDAQGNKTEAALKAVLAAHDIQVLETPEEARERKVTKIRTELEENDRNSIRPLRAKDAGTATDDDLAILIKLEERASELRIELQVLSQESDSTE